MPSSHLKLYQCWQAAQLTAIHPRIAVCARRFTKIPKSTLTRAWEKARDKAGLKHLHFHDLRHSSASEMVNAGVDLYTVGAVLGHKDARSTKRYSHLATETLSAAILRIGKKSPESPKRKSA